MCDGCGNIFSVLEDGWSSAPISRVTRDANGQQKVVTEHRDMGPCCTTPGVKSPRLAIDAATGVDRIAKTQTQADRDRLLTLDDDETPF